MTATKAVSKTTVLAAARKRYSKRVNLRTYPNATSEAKRQEARGRRAEIKTELADIEAELKATKTNVGMANRDLRKAARFVVDTDADPTALDALRKALEFAEWFNERLSRKGDLESESRELIHATMHYKYSLGTIEGVGGIQFSSIKHEADTLAELLEKIEQ